MKRHAAPAVSRREWLKGVAAIGVTLPITRHIPPVRAATAKFDNVRDHLHHLI